MFSLIISIISIALVAALAAATVYFGGSAFNKGADDALASTFINGAQQINGAFSIAASSNDAAVSTVSTLTGEYLQQIPSINGTVLDSLAGDYLVYKTTAGVCDSIEKKKGTTTLPSAATAAAYATPTALYGCMKVSGDVTSIPDITVAANEYVAFYRVL